MITSNLTTDDAVWGVSKNCHVQKTQQLKEFIDSVVYIPLLYHCMRGTYSAGNVRMGTFNHSSDECYSARLWPGLNANDVQHCKQRTSLDRRNPYISTHLHRIDNTLLLPALKFSTAHVSKLRTDVRL
jgi:hypothetical protein